jgi:endonuclease G
LWQGLEQYVLEQTAQHYQFRVQVMTGPIFDEFDPVYEKVKLPLSFWKVIVAVADDEDEETGSRLFATAFVLSQERYIDPDKIDYESTQTGALRKDLFSKWKGYQRPIEEIERLTRLKFQYGPDNAKRDLAELDPFAKELAKEPWRRRTRRRVTDRRESFALSNGGVLRNDGEFESYGDIILG